MSHIHHYTHLAMMMMMMMMMMMTMMMMMMMTKVKVMGVQSTCIGSPIRTKVGKEESLDPSAVSGRRHGQFIAGEVERACR